MISEGRSNVTDQIPLFYFPPGARKVVICLKNVSFWARMDFSRASKMPNDFEIMNSDYQGRSSMRYKGV